MSSTKRQGWAVISCLVLATSASGGSHHIESNFAESAQGWSAVTFTSSCTTPVAPSPTDTPIWSPSGGVQDGYITLIENAITSISPYFRAPAPYRGDHAAAYGGAITMELRYTHSNNDIFYPLADIYLLGDGITLIADTENPSRDSWGFRAIPLLPEAWRVGTCDGPPPTEAQLLAVLSAIEEIYIRVEYAEGDESLDLDQFSLTSNPQFAPDRATWSELDDIEPTGRWRHAVAIDTDHNILVLFGGDSGETDTWEYDLTTNIWTRTNPQLTPTRRGGHAMAYDTARQRIVMTGGGYIDQRSSEVWEYDTQTDSWELAPPLDEPRAGHAMAYDSLRQTLVIYGGITDTENPNGTVVLERSSASDQWVQRTADTNPGHRAGIALAYDQARQRTVLVGNGDTTLIIAEWNGLLGTWDFPTVAGTNPNNRFNSTLTYDPIRNRCILIGGQGFNSAWSYDGTSWALISRMPNDDGRDEHAAAYDPASDSFLVSGGILNAHTPQRDILAMDGATNTWTTRWSRSACGPRDYFSMIFDEQRNDTVIFGGGLVTRSSSDIIGSGTFSFDGDTWTTLPTTGAVGTRWFAPMVYDPQRQVALLYGGTNSAVGNLGAGATQQFWMLDLETLQWVEQPGLTPGRRYDHAAMYDRDRGQLVIHGGFDEQVDRLADTWIFTSDTDTWTTLSPGTTTPGPRNGSSFAFDEHRGVGVLFGGRLGTSATWDNSTWEWDGETWTDVTPTGGNPPSRLIPIMVYNPYRRTVLMYSGLTNRNNDNDVSQNARAFQDLWEWDGTAWTPLTVENAFPVGMVGANAVYDRTNDRLIHFGGKSADRDFYRNGQTYALNISPITPPCPTDLNNSGATDLPDLNLILANFGMTTTASDTNNDGVVDLADLNAVLAAFGQPCP